MNMQVFRLKVTVWLSLCISHMYFERGEIDCILYFGHYLKYYNTININIQSVNVILNVYGITIL